LQKVGIPLTLALSLLRDLNGKISLTVPVSGDKSGTQVAIRDIIAQALVKAILGAVTSPLKMLGVVADLATGGAQALPEPIPCGSGLPVVEASADARVQQLGDALGGAPALRITLHGIAGGPDVRTLQEAAVLGDLNAKLGVIGGLKSLANRRERNAIRDFLTARTSGDSAPELSPDYRKTLDEWAQAKTVSDDQLRALANARAEVVKTALVTRQGVDARARYGRGSGDRSREREPGCAHRLRAVARRSAALLARSVLETLLTRASDRQDNRAEAATSEEVRPCCSCPTGCSWLQFSLRCWSHSAPR
jgi:hypothetical protein